jgi:hypothetical protein
MTLRADIENAIGDTLDTMHLADVVRLADALMPLVERALKQAAMEGASAPAFTRWDTIVARVTGMTTSLPPGEQALADAIDAEIVRSYMPAPAVDHAAEVARLRAVIESALNDVCGISLCSINSMSSRQEMGRLAHQAAANLRAALAEAEESRGSG